MGGEGVMTMAMSQNGLVTNFVEAVFVDTLSVHTLHFVAFPSENTNRSSLISWCPSIVQWFNQNCHGVLKVGSSMEFIDSWHSSHARLRL